MFRVSQGILTVALLGILVSFAFGWRCEVSLSRGPDGSVLKRPMSALWKRGKVYVVDTGNARLVSFSLNGTSLKAINPGNRLKVPLDMDFSEDGRLWVLARSNNSLLEVNLRTKSIREWRVEYGGRVLFLERIKWWRGRLYALDRTKGGIVEAEFTEGKGFKVRDYWLPEVEDFRGFVDFKVKDGALWALEAERPRLYERNSGRVVNLGSGPICPISFEIIKKRVYLLDRCLKKVFVYRLKKPEEVVYSFIREGWSRCRLYLPRYMEEVEGGFLVVDEGAGRVDVWMGGGR